MIRIKEIFHQAFYFLAFSLILCGRNRILSGRNLLCYTRLYIIVLCPEKSLNLVI